MAGNPALGISQAASAGYVIDIPGTKLLVLTNDLTSLVDADIYEQHSGSCPKWVAHKTHHGKFYARRAFHRRVEGKRIVRRELLHRLILQAPSNLQVDHINGDTLDNRRCNLRFCTNAQNQWNVPKIYPSSSRYKGVSFYKRNNKWGANIRVNNKQMFLGLFDEEIEAARAYNAAALKYHDEFARENSIL